MVALRGGCSYERGTPVNLVPWQVLQRKPEAKIAIVVKTTPPQGPPLEPRCSPLWGPRRGVFLISEVPLYHTKSLISEVRCFL